VRKFWDDNFWDRLHLWAQVWVLFLLAYAVFVKAEAIVMYLCGLAGTLVTGTGVVHGWKETQRIKMGNGTPVAPPPPTVGGFKPDA
jgi:hypothetical protein